LLLHLISQNLSDLLLLHLLHLVFEIIRHLIPDVDLYLLCDFFQQIMLLGYRHTTLSVDLYRLLKLVERLVGLRLLPSALLNPHSLRRLVIVSFLLLYMDIDLLASRVHIL